MARLRICDICSKTIRIRVDHAKHNTNRYTILSTTALKILRQYFKEYFSSTEYKADDWLFPEQNPKEHITVKTIKNTLIKLRNRLNLNPNISAHTLRHCFATHALEEDILGCRTSALGGHVYKCSECGQTIVRYNSCRNRHCSLCQGINKAVWVDKRSKDILNAPYFHLVFTLPQQLHPLVYQNQELLYGLMYKAVAETITELSSDPKYLGAQVGFFSILHTWGQDLHYHPHIHTVVLAGGLDKYNKWRNTSKKFFIPVKVLSKKFRGKFLFYLKQYYQQNLLKFYKDAQQYKNPKSFKQLLDQCYLKNWYSYTKKTFSGPLAVIQYLGRYTHRIAISNNRIVSIDQDTVTFTVKGYKKKKTVTLTGIEFIRRFLMHILPKGFVKIRHYGLLANRNKKIKLALCRRLTYSPSYKPKYEGLKTIEIISLLLGKDATKCSACKKGTLEAVKTFYPGAEP